jgi:hypothetical protein
MTSVAITMVGAWGEEACTPQGGPLLSILKGRKTLAALGLVRSGAEVQIV